MSILSELPIKKAKENHLTLRGHELTVDRWLASDRIQKSAKADNDTVRANLVPVVRRFWLDANAGRQAPVPSVKLVGNLGEVLVSFASLWSPAEDVVKALPAHLVRETFSLKIDQDSIPAGKAKEFVRAFLDFAQAWGVRVEAKGEQVPIPAFGALRHTLLSVAENERLEDSGLGTRVTFKRTDGA